MIVFEDGTHALIEVPYSDEIEITFLEYDYEEEDEEFEGEEDDEHLFDELLEGIMKKNKKTENE